MLIFHRALVAGIVTLLAAAVMTLVVRTVAARVGAIAKPRADRWHRRPTAMFGGVAIGAATLAALAVVNSFVGIDRSVLVVFGVSASMLLLGFVDDIVELSAPTKLVVQVLAAAFLVYMDVTLRWTSIEALNAILTIFWFVGITNALNLLDGMDGLAAGIVTIACVVMTVFFVHQGDTGPAMASAILGGACAGFLIFNFNPASIFMGDCGSLFIGSAVASLTLLSSSGRSRNLLATLAVPVLVMLVPIFDTTFVTIVRTLSGRRISEGGLDHTSHRLVALGLTERGAVLALWGLSSLSGALAIWSRLSGLSTALALAVPLVIFVTFVGVYLAREKVYAVPDRAATPPGYVPFLADLAYKRRIFEVLLDVVLILVAYLGAHLLRHDGVLPSHIRIHFITVLPTLLGLKIATFASTGLYRGIWRYTGVEDVVRISRSVAAASIVFALAAAFLYRMHGFSRSALILDGLLLLLLTGGSRISFRLLRTFLRRRSADARRALIFGAGDRGELVLRELRNNAALALQPVGFIDDDARLRGKVIHDLRILGGAEDIPEIVRHHRISTIVVSSDAIGEDVSDDLARSCSNLDVEIRRLRIALESR